MKELPHSTQAEQAVIYCIMMNKDAAATAFEMLREDDFYNRKLKIMFGACQLIYSRLEDINYVSVVDELKRIEKLDVCGYEFVMNLIEKTKEYIISAWDIKPHCEVILAKSTLRTLYKISEQIRKDCEDETKRPVEIVQEADNILLQTVIRTQSDFQHISAGLPKVVSYLEQAHQNPGMIFGLRTGYKDIDRTLGGMVPGDFIVLAAITSDGKTAFALNLARRIAKNGVSVGVVSMEMKDFKLIFRLLAIDAQIDANKAKMGELVTDDWQSIAHSTAELANMPIYFDCQAGQTINQIRAKAKRAAVQFGIKFLVIDYIQLIAMETKYANRAVEVGIVTRNIKTIAEELSIPVMALSQLSREIQKGAFRLPRLADLKESSSIEQDADAVIFISRPERYEVKSFELGGKSYDTKNLSLISIEKNRDGASHVIMPFRFVPERTEFAEIEANYEEPKDLF